MAKRTLRSHIFWGIGPCDPLKVNRYFRGKCCLHLRGRRISQARKPNGAYLVSVLQCFYECHGDFAGIKALDFFFDFCKVQLKNVDLSMIFNKKTILSVFYSKEMSRDSAVGIATGYGLDD
jgi:hypothetical protein